MKKTPSILKSKVLIIKIGSSLLIKSNKFDKTWLQGLVKEISFLRSKEIKIIVVTSGAVPLGRNYLKVDTNKKLNTQGSPRDNLRDPHTCLLILGRQLIDE